MSQLTKIIANYFNSHFCSSKEKRTKLANLMKKLGFEPKLIVFMDGGLCSQINQFAIGQYYKEKGYNVLDNCIFFEKNGKDLNGKFDRNYQLDKFLRIDADQINKIKEKSLLTYIYERFFYNANNVSPNPILGLVSDDYCPPIFLNNYYCFNSDILKTIWNKYIHLKKMKKY